MTLQVKKFPKDVSRDQYSILQFSIQDVTFTSDEIINYFLSNTTLSNIRTRLTNFLLRCPLKTYKQTKDGKEETTDKYNFLAKPNSQETLEIILERLVNSYVVSGECFLQAIRVGKEVKEIWVKDPIGFLRNYPLNSKMSGIQVDNVGNLVAYNYNRDNVSISYEAEEISHAFNPSIDFRQYLRGVSIFFPAKESIVLIEQATDYNRSLVSQGGIPPMIVKMDNLLQGGWGKDENGEELNKFGFFSRLYRTWFGTKNAGKSQLVDKDTEITTLAFNVDEMQLHETLKSAESKIIQCVGGTAGAFGDISDQSYNTLLEQRLDTFENVLVPFAAKIASVFNKFLEKGEWAEFDFSNEQIIQAIKAKKVKEQLEQFKAGIITRDEFRAEISKDPIDNANLFYFDIQRETPTEPKKPEKRKRELSGLKISENGLSDSNIFDSAITQIESLQTRLKKEAVAIETKEAELEVIWKKFDEVSKPLIDDLQPKYLAVYKETEKLILGEVKGFKDLEGDVNNFDWGKVEGLFSGVIAETSYDILKSGYAHLLQEIEESGSLLVTDSRVESYIDLRRVRSVNMTNTIKEQVENQIRLGLELQETEQQLALRIQNHISGISEYNATRIATTEVTTAFGKGQIDAMNDFGIPYKMWVSERDSKVRPTHQILDGEIVAVNKPFTNGLQSPSEPNCRCTLSPVRDLKDN